ncbi:MAG: hypothetical protein R6X10_09780 [Desulfobacterales bacterium]
MTIIIKLVLKIPFEGETLKTRPAKDMLSTGILQNSQYTLDPEVRFENNAKIYTVTTQSGKFTVRGDVMLRRFWQN